MLKNPINQIFVSVLLMTGTAMPCKADGQADDILKSRAMTSVELESRRTGAAVPSRNDAARAFAAWKGKTSMFLNFGLYSVAGGQWDGRSVEGRGGEALRAGLFSDEYEALARSFNPVSFNASGIVAAALKAGMKSVIFTARSHDGFCMFATETTSFNSVDATPSGRNFVKELSDECERKGIGFGIYFSLTDWHFPQAAPISSHNADVITPEHHAYNLAQLRELLSGCGRISEIIFGAGAPTVAQSADMYNLVKEMQPDCLVGGAHNDMCDFVRLPECVFPRIVPDVPWQYFARMYPQTWGYREWEDRGDVLKKAAACVSEMDGVTSGGGNYALAVALDGNGSMLPFEEKVLEEIGRLRSRPVNSSISVPGASVREAFRSGEVLDRRNAEISHALTSIDDYLMSVSETAYTWTVSRRSPKAVELSYTSEEVGSFVSVGIDGETFDVELLPDGIEYSGLNLNFVSQRYAALPERHFIKPLLTADTLDRAGLHFRPVTGECLTYFAEPMSSVVIERVIFSSGEGKALVNVVSGSAVEVFCNGKTVMRRINENLTGRNETLCLVDMKSGSNTILVKSYSRYGGTMVVGVTPSANRKIYKTTCRTDAALPGSTHEVSIYRKNTVSPYNDAKLNNISIMVK